MTGRQWEGRAITGPVLQGSQPLVPKSGRPPSPQNSLPTPTLGEGPRPGPKHSWCPVGMNLLEESGQSGYKLQVGRKGQEAWAALPA